MPEMSRFYDIIIAMFYDEQNPRRFIAPSGLVLYAVRGGVFSRFADKNYFDAVALNRELGVLCWPDGVDIAPETIYESAMMAQYNMNSRRGFV